MNIDPRICSQARLSRDARFDGRFFIGVKSTRIYCRPICPVRTAKEQNVRYFPSAAAAAEAGYRPCMRCRPESSPGTPAWSGTSTTVSRALRLISESALEEAGVNALAARLGIGSRQLRRLFVRHLGASPIGVANTRRLHFAKKLIDETHLPMGQIAIASGFGSVRRFNAAFRKTYNRTPSQIRRFAHLASKQLEHEYLFRLHFRPPFQWDALLDFLGRRAIPGVESVEDGSYRRTISLNGDSGSLAVSIDESDSALQVRISFPDPRWLFLIIERVRRMFDLAADPNEIASLLAKDTLLAKRVALSGASTLAGRLIRTFGTPIIATPPLNHLFPTPEVLAVADIVRIGLPKKRAGTIRAFAKAVTEGRVAFSSVANVEGFQTRLRELPGIGDWTAQYIAMRALGDPDAFPASDLGLLRASSLGNQLELAERAEAWRPWRAYAAMYLWESPTEGNLTKQPSTKHVPTLARSATRCEEQ